ncbi:unnamed protein product, partial [Schistosoma guineensis]
MGTDVLDRMIERDIALSSGFTSDTRETVSVGVGKDAEDDESNCMVVDGWSDYSSECIHDEHKPSVSVGSPTRLVSVETQATDSVSWLATDTLSTSGFTDQSTVDQSTRSPLEMTREKVVSSGLCEDESNVVGQLREELTSCYEQIVKLSRSVEESDASLMDVRRLLTVKESEVADLREEKRHLRDEVNELRETVEAERRDLDIMRANMDVLESKEEVSAMCEECRGPNVAAAAAAAAVEEECVQTEIDDEVFDLVSTLQLEVAHLREENAATLAALERSQLELSMKQTEVQEPESRMMVNETTWWIPCETVRKAPDVVVRELAEVDDTDRVEADVFAGVPDMQLVETVAGDSVSGIVPDRMDRQTTDLCVEGVSNEEVVLPIHATQSWTKPPSEQDNDDLELALLNTDSLRARLKEAMSRICELENAKTELSVRLLELEGVMMCEDKPMDVMPLSSRVPDRSMKVTDEADALSKHNKELMTEVDLLRSKISERVTLLDDVCMEMDEVRGSLGFLLKQVRELRAAHAEANADRAEMANRMSEYERVSHRLCETVGRSTSPVQDIDYAHEGSSTDRCTSDGLREDLQRALDTQSFELEAVTEKLRECESMNNALICECESLKRRLESYMTVITDLENDVTKTKALLAFVVDHIRGLRSDYGDWCREHEQRVQECLDAVTTGLSHGVVEHVDRECETMTWPEHLESTVMLDSFVRLQESHEVTSMQRGQDWDSVSEMSRLCDRNRELSEELCKCRDLCDKQASEMVLMQTALRQAVEQASTAREELEAYRHEKVCAMSDLESQLSASRDECSALRDQVCRLETSMEEHCNTVLAIASRDWESRVNEIVRERDTAMKELLELRSRLDMTDDVDARLAKTVCRSDMGTDVLDRMIERDIALSSGFTSDTRETVSVGVGKDAEDDESNCMVVDGWSDYSSECIHDEHKPSVSVGSPTRLVSVETQATDSVSWLATDTLSTSGFTDQSTVDQSTRSPLEMTREKVVSSGLCEDESNVVGQLREELTSCYEQIVKLSRSVEESDASLMDVRRLLTVKESEVADLREEKRHLRDEVNELRETVEAERRDLDIMRANMDVLESKEEVSAMCEECRGPNVAAAAAAAAAVEEECVQTEIDDEVFDLVSTLQLEVAHLREENAATLAALERSQLELSMKQTEVQEPESRMMVNETTWWIPCETVRKAPDVVVRELAEVDDTDRVEADVFAGVPDMQLVETVAGDSVSGIVPDRMDRQTTDLCVEGVSNEEVVLPIHATQSWTKPPSEQDNDDPELALLNTDSLRARLKEAMSRICELENAKTELSVRLLELEGVMMCEDKPMDVMPLSSRVPDRSMKVTDEADALSKHNKELMTEVDLLRSKISERVTLLDDVCMEMDEVRGSLGFLLKQVRELRAAHAEANADRAEMANRMSEYERVSHRLCETVGRSTSPVQDIDYAHEGSSTDRCTSDGLREDLQRALDTQSFELEAVTEKLRECESMNNALICECESLKRRLESYMTVITDLENDVTKTKALLAFVVDHIRGLRSDYGDWCREHEQRVQECLDAVTTGLSHGVVEHVDRECETMTWPEHLESTVMLDSFVRLQESHEVTSMQRGQDWDSVSEMSRLCDRNRELSEELCKCRDLCDKQASEMVLMQTALRQAVEQASTAREELEAYRHEKVCAMSDLESQLSASRDECSALRDQVCRLETSMEEHCNTVLAIASRDWESRVNEIVRERDTAMKELLELRSRLDMTDDVDARLAKTVCRSDMGTDVLDRMIERDIALSSGFTSDTRETVSVGVGKDAEDDESNCMVVDGWSDYSSECIHDEHKPSVSVGSPTRLVSVETQATDSVSWLATDTLSTSGFTDQSTVDQSTRSPLEMTREKVVSSGLCEDESNVVGQLREELTSCYEQIVKLSRSVEESDASLMDVRRLLTVKESEVADLREEKRHLRDEVNELRETVEAERRDLDIMRANMDVLESKEEVSAMCEECRGPNVAAAAAAAAAAVEEECVQTEIDDEVFDLVSTLQLEVAHLREENAATLAALERSQLELSMKQTEVQEPESRMMVNETTWWIPCETVRKAPDVVVRELAEVDDTDRVEADVFAGVPDMQLVETVAGDSVSGIVPDRMDRQTTDLCVEGVSNEEVVLPIHATQSWTKPPSEQDNDDLELALLNTDSLRARLKEAMSRICELENAKTELSVRLLELEGVMMCEDKPMDVMPLSSRVPDRSMKVTDEADALSKHNKELMTEVDLLRSKISERVTLLDDVCMEMDEVRGSLGFLLKQVRELRAAHAEANADRAEMANRMSEYERVSHRLCETVGRSTSPVQDIDYAHEGSSTDRCTSDGLREDLQRALDTQSFELEAVTEKLRECESMNNALICECESLKRRLESYMTVITDLENDVTKTKALLAFVVDHIRGLRSDYGDWCREHEQRVQECLDAVTTGLSHGVVEHVDRECETMTWPEHLESTVMLDSFVRLQESHEVTSMQRGQDWDSVSEMSRLCDRNRELSEELCKCRDLCDKQASEMVLMQTALRQAVEQASTAREELEAYRHEKVCAMSDLESQLSASRDECSALRDQVCRLETSMEEHCNTVLAIASRDWESRVNEIVRERDTAMKELLELRSRLDMTDDVDARLAKTVCRSDMGTDVLDRMIERDLALSSGFTSDTRETVSVGVGKDAEDDESNCMVVDGWSDYSSECIHDEHKPSVSVGSPTRLVSVETQATDSVSWLATDTLSTSGFTDQSTVDQSTRSPLEMTREKVVSSGLCEDESNVVGQLREELTSCYEQIVKLSRSVEESDASLMDVRRLLTVKESEVADLREEKRHLRDEVNELRETVEAERRDLDIMRANMDVLESKEEVSAMCEECRGPNVAAAAAAAAAAAVEEECVQTEIDDEVFDLVSTLQLEVAHLREENAATLAALERSQLELSMKQTEVQEPESRMMVNETTWWIPCETVRKAPDVVVRELAEVDDTDRVEADVFAGVPDMQLVETVAGDSVSGIVPDRMDRQTTDLCVEGVSNDEVVLPIHATQSWTKPPSEQDNDDLELALLNTDSLRARLKEAMSRICELENAKTELSVRLLELEGVMMCEDKPMDVMPLSSRVPDRSMKVTDEADALSKHNKELMTEVDLLRSKISERVTLLDDVCMEMDEVRGSLGFLLKQVRELRAAHAEANADRAEMANRMSEYERVSHRLCETVGRSTSPVQDIDYAHEGSSTDRCTSDGLREDLQRALDTQSFELEAVTEKLRECESMNNALICECESLKRRLESYMTVITDLENDVTKTKALLAFVVDHIRGLRSDYGDWCREHKQRVQECLDAVTTGLSHGVV